MMTNKEKFFRKFIRKNNNNIFFLISFTVLIFAFLIEKKLIPNNDLVCIIFLLILSSATLVINKINTGIYSLHRLNYESMEALLENKKILKKFNYFLERLEIRKIQKIKVKTKILFSIEKTMSKIRKIISNEKKELEKILKIKKGFFEK